MATCYKSFDRVVFPENVFTSNINVLQLFSIMGTVN